MGGRSALRSIAAILVAVLAQTSLALSATVAAAASTPGASRAAQTAPGARAFTVAAPAASQAHGSLKALKSLKSASPFGTQSTSAPRQAGRTSAMASPDPAATGTQELLTIDFVDTQHGWMGGFNGQSSGLAYTTRDGGTTWVELSLPADVGTVWSVSFISPTVGWAVGSVNNSFNQKASILATTNGGQTWTEETPPANVAVLYAAKFIDASHGWAVGYSASPPSYLPRMVVVATSDGGATWVPQPVPDPPNGVFTSSLGGLSFLDAMHGWVVGGYQDTFYNNTPVIYVTADGGATWSPQTLPAGAGVGLSSVDFVNSSDGWAGDGSGYGVILHTTDGGATWVVQRSSNSTDITALAFLDPSNGTAVGVSGANAGTGVVLGTINGGASYTSESVPQDAMNLRSVSFVSTSTGWIDGFCGNCSPGYHGVVLKTTDGGATWVAQALPTSGPAPSPPPAPTPPSQSGGGSPSGTPPSSCQQTGHPVNCATGEFWHRFLDLSVSGRGQGLSLTRTYSATLAGQDGPLGFGWTDSYNMSLAVAGDGSVSVTEEGGSTIVFVPNGTGGYQAPAWVFATLAKNSDGSYTLRRKNQTSFTFSATGQLTREQDRNGYATTLTYANNQLAAVSDSAGRQLQFQYVGSRIVRISDPIQRAVAFQYDSAGNLVAATDAGNAVTRFTYDANHLMLTMTDPNGGVLSNTYGASARVVSQTDAMHRTTTWAYGSGMTTLTDPKGNRTQETFQNGQLVSITKGLGTAQAATWTMGYDPTTFALASVSDPNGHRTTYSTDASGNVLGVTDALGRSWTFRYDGLNDLTAIADPAGATTQLAYDANGNLITITKSLTGTTQLITTLGYDAANPGDVVTVTDPGGNAWRLVHDRVGDVIQAVDPLGNSTTFTVDQVGRVTTTISARGNVPGANPGAYTTSYARNAYNNLLQVTDPLGHTTTYRYDGNQNLVGSSDANGHTTTYLYNLDNEPLSGMGADGSRVQSVYDADGNLTSQADPLGDATTYAYDPLNRLVTMTDPLGRATAIAYDGAGNPTALTDPAGRTTSYTYDAAGQLTAIAYSDGKTPHVSFTYEQDGRRTGMTDGTGSSTYAYDAIGRLVQSITGSGAKTGYGYDLNGHPTGLMYPDGSQVLRTFDAAGRLTRVTDWLAHQTSFSYDANGNLVGQAYPNGTVAAFAYDAADQLTQITDSGPQGQLSFLESRDALGQVTSEKVAGAPPNSPVSYAYDAANRLATANYGGPQIGYQYDAAGRLTQVTDRLGGWAVSTARSYDSADQLLSLTATLGNTVVAKRLFSYDPNGNRTTMTDQGGRTTTYGYDQANRLTAYGATANYSYNGDGLRMSKTVGGVAEAFTWDLVGSMPVMIQDGATRYVTGAGGMPLEQVAANGTVRYYHQDALGSTRALTNASGKVDTVYFYDPYGKVVSITGSKTANPLQFAGQYTDAESGLQYLRARYYDPATAQFITRDPVSAITGHPYGYADGNPVNRTDPTGLLSFGDVWGFLKVWGEPLGALASAGSIIFGSILPIIPLAVFFEATSALLGVVNAINDAAKGNWLGAGIAIAAGIAGGAGIFFRFAAAAKKAAALAMEGVTLTRITVYARLILIQTFDLGALARMAFQIAKAREVATTFIATVLDGIGMLLTALSEPPIINAGDTTGGPPNVIPAC